MYSQSLYDKCFFAIIWNLKKYGDNALMSVKLAGKLYRVSEKYHK